MLCNLLLISVIREWEIGVHPPIFLLQCKYNMGVAGVIESCYHSCLRSSSSSFSSIVTLFLKLFPTSARLHREQF